MLFFRLVQGIFGNQRSESDTPTSLWEWESNSLLQKYVGPME